MNSFNGGELCYCMCMLQLLVGFSRGLMILWNVETNSAELTYVAATVSYVHILTSSGIVHDDRSTIFH